MKSEGRVEGSTSLVFFLMVPGPPGCSPFSHPAPLPIGKGGVWDSAEGAPPPPLGVWVNNGMRIRLLLGREWTCRESDGGRVNQARKEQQNGTKGKQSKCKHIKKQGQNRKVGQETGLWYTMVPLTGFDWWHFMPSLKGRFSLQNSGTLCVSTSSPETQAKHSIIFHAWIETRP